MRDVAEDQCALQVRLQGLLHPGVQRVGVGPERRGLEGLDEDADVEQRVAQVRRVEPAVRPGLARAVALGAAAEGGQRLGHGGPAGLDLRGGALVTHDHQAGALGAALADGVGAGEVDRGLGLVREPQDGGQQALLRQVAHRVAALGERRPAPALVDLDLGEPADPDGDGGDDAEGALGAEHELAQVGAGGVGRRGAEDPLTARGGDPQAHDHRVEAAVAGRGLAAGAGRGEAADRGELEGLGEVTQHQAALVQQRLGLRAAQAGLEGGGHRLLVDGQQLLHPHQVEGDQARVAVAACGEPAGHAGAAAEGDDREVVLDGHGQDRGDVVVAAGPDHRVGRVGQVARAGPQQVGRGLPTGAQPAYLVVEQDVLLADGGAQGRERRLPQRGRGDRRGLRRRGGAQPEGHLDESAGALGEVGRSIRAAPPQGVHLAEATGQRSGGRVRRHVLQCDI